MSEELGYPTIECDLPEFPLWPDYLSGDIDPATQQVHDYDLPGQDGSYSLLLGLHAPDSELKLSITAPTIEEAVTLKTTIGAIKGPLVNLVNDLNARWENVSVHDIKWEPISEIVRNGIKCFEVRATLVCRLTRIDLET